jgi:hypothetical protein
MSNAAMPASVTAAAAAPQVVAAAPVGAPAPVPPQPMLVATTPISLPDQPGDAGAAIEPPAVVEQTNASPAGRPNPHPSSTALTGSADQPSGDLPSSATTGPGTDGASDAETPVAFPHSAVAQPHPAPAPPTPHPGRTGERPTAPISRAVPPRFTLVSHTAAPHVTTSPPAGAPTQAEFSELRAAASLPDVAPPAAQPLAAAPVDSVPSAAPLAHEAALPQPRLLGAVAQLRHHDGVHHVTVALHPEELGAVRVSATVHGDSVSVHVACADAPATSAVNTALPTLERSLEQAGFTTVQLGVEQHAAGDREQPGSRPPSPGRDDSESARDTPAPRRRVGRAASRVAALDRML